MIPGLRRILAAIGLPVRFTRKAGRRRSFLRAEAWVQRVIAVPGRNAFETPTSRPVTSAVAAAAQNQPDV